MKKLHKSVYSAVMASACFVGTAVPAAAYAGQPLGDDAIRFSRGSTICFELGAHQGEYFKHFKLIFAPANDYKPYNVIPVHGVQRANDGSGTYVNQLAGTATLAPSNDPAVGGLVLQVGLTATGYEVTVGGNDELWTDIYNLQLKPRTLAGKIYGTESETKPLVAGDSADTLTLNTVAVVMDVRRMSCRDF